MRTVSVTKDNYNIDNASSFGKVLAIYKKELSSEFRTRYSITAVLLFVLTSVTMIFFSIAGQKLNAEISSGIIWTIIFFGTMTGAAKSFVSEEERGTTLLLQIYSPDYAVLFGKMFFNASLCTSINLLSLVLFFVFSGFSGDINIYVLLLSIIVGGLSVASVTTIISAITARAGSKNALFPVLSFPALLPIILISVDTTFQGLTNGSLLEVYRGYFLEIAYSGIIIVGSYFLFEHVWKD